MDVVDAVAPLAVLARAVAGETMAGTLEAGVLADIHVQQIAGARPLVAVGGLACRPGWPRDPGPLEHFPDGRVAKAGRAGDQARPPSPSCVGRHRSPRRARARAASASGAAGSSG